MRYKFYPNPARPESHDVWVYGRSALAITFELRLIMSWYERNTGASASNCALIDPDTGEVIATAADTKYFDFTTR